jgi:hypothetical protein
MASSGESTDMTLKKVTGQKKIKMEKLAIFSTRMVAGTVTGLSKSLMEQYIEESSKICIKMVMVS